MLVSHEDFLRAGALEVTPHDLPVAARPRLAARLAGFAFVVAGAVVMPPYLLLLGAWLLGAEAIRLVAGAADHAAEILFGAAPAALSPRPALAPGPEPVAARIRRG